MLQMLHYKKDMMLEKTEENKNKMLKALEEYYGIVTTASLEATFQDKKLILETIKNLESK